MTLLTAEHWLFSIKTFLAGVLALAIAFFLDLPRPYWALATVYIASQPLAGATHSKAFFRALGTLAGAAMAILLVPNLVNEPPVLVLAMALWSGLCLYLSALDRTPRGYAFMLAGYTTALIGFPAVDAPAAIFDLALSRTEEISVGIVCAALVSSLVFPRSVGPVVAERVARWIEDAKAAARDAPDGADTAASRTHWRRLASDTAQIENLAAHLPFEASSGRRAESLMRRLVPRMLMTLPEISALSDVIRELSLLGGPSARIEALVTRIDGALAAGEEEVGADLLCEIDALVASSTNLSSWREVTEFNLLVRLRALVAIFCDAATLARSLAADTPNVPAQLVFQLDAGVSRARHQEHGPALVSALTLSLAIVLCCAFWIATGWPDGAAAAMMTAVAGSLFATQDDPAPSIKRFAEWSAVAVVISGVYVFLILPRVHSFETLVLALAPALLSFGLLIAEPKTFMIGLPLGILTPSAMALQQAYGLDGEIFLNSGFAMVGGMWIALATTAVTRKAGATRRAANFSHANQRALAKVADIANRSEESVAIGLMLDRLALLAPLAQAAQEGPPDALRQLRAGINLLYARRARAALPATARGRVDAALLSLQRAYRDHLPPAQEALDALNRAIQSLRPGDAGDRAALLALVGLRRCLFPAAALAPLAIFGDSP